MNLAVNARDAMPARRQADHRDRQRRAGRQLRAHAPPASAPGEYVMLAVTDTGVGHGHRDAGAHLRAVLSPPKRVKGTGLGLATVYGIVKQSGGYIWVYSEPDRDHVQDLSAPGIA